MHALLTQKVNEDQVREIVAEVVSRVLAARSSEPDSGLPSRVGGVGGVFGDADAAVVAARRTQGQLLSMTLEDRKRIIEAIRNTLRSEAESFARRTLEETGMGRLEDKIRKHHVAADTTPGVEDLRARFRGPGITASP